MTLSEEFARLLHDLGLGVYKTDGTIGGSIYLTTLPDTPDQAMAVARYPGGEADTKLGYDEVNVQVKVRGDRADVRTGETTAQAVYDKLHGLGQRVLAGGTRMLLAVGNQSGPVYVGRDGNGRHEWMINFRIELRRVTANRV